MTRIDRIITMPYTHLVRVHRSCVCNELVSLCNRHLIDRRQPLYNREYILSGIKKEMRRLDLQMGLIERMTMWDIVRSYSGAKRRSYAKAYAEVKIVGFDKKYANVQMFVKPDKYDGYRIYQKAPRAIQYRDPKFNLFLASYLKPIEHALYQTVDQVGMRWCAKGLNNTERANLIIASADLFDNPIFLLLDHSKFDSSITIDHLKLCAKAYQRWVGGDKFLRYLLSLQWRNKGRTKGGIFYRIEGTKMSGDYNTALDNSLINYLCLTHFMGKIKHKTIVDGDDSVVIMEKSSFNNLDFKHFNKWGFDTVCDVVNTIDEVEFCRSKILDLGGEGVMAREPRRALSNMCVGLKQYQGQARFRYLAGNALGEMHRSSRCPILYPVARAIYEKWGQKGVIMDTESAYKLELYRCDHQPPTLVERYAYERSYGIPVERQLEIEQEILSSISVSTEEFGLYNCAEEIIL